MILIDFTINTADGDKFVTLSATGTTNQAPITSFW